MVGLLCYKDTLLECVQLPFYQAASLQSCFPTRWPPADTGAWGLHLLKCIGFLLPHFSSLSWSFQMAVQLPSVSHTPSFVLSKNLHSVPSSRSLLKMFNSIDPLGMLLVDWPPTELHAAAHNPLSLAVQLFFSPSHYPLTQAVFHQFVHDDVILMKWTVVGTYNNVTRQSACIPTAVSHKGHLSVTAFPACSSQSVCIHSWQQPCHVNHPTMSL